MKNRLIASVLAGSIALTTAVSTPAMALDQGERNRLALGLGALAIIGAIANQGGSSGHVDRNDHRWDNRWDDRRDDWRKGRDHRSNWLPKGCEFTVKTRQGNQNVLGKSCLSQADIRVSQLPSSCEFDIRTNRGKREVFGSRCLRDRGYRIEARR